MPVQILPVGLLSRAGLAEPDPLSNCMKEFTRPYLDALRILQKQPHLLPRLADVKAVDRLMQQGQKRFRCQLLRDDPVSSLPHPLFQVRQVHSGMVAHEPNKMVPITTFHAVVPSPPKGSPHETTGPHNALCMRQDRKRSGPAREPDGAAGVFNPPRW
jgi:hypothetical protein